MFVSPLFQWHLFCFVFPSFFVFCCIFFSFLERGIFFEGLGEDPRWRLRMCDVELRGDELGSCPREVHFLEGFMGRRGAGVLSENYRNQARLEKTLTCFRGLGLIYQR